MVVTLTQSHVKTQSEITANHERKQSEITANHEKKTSAIYGSALKQLEDENKKQEALDERAEQLNNQDVQAAQSVWTQFERLQTPAKGKCS